MSMMDKGEFVKASIEIAPAANGGYVVRRVPKTYDCFSISDALAFSNYTDLLNWMVKEYPAAHSGAETTTTSS